MIKQSNPAVVCIKSKFNFLIIIIILWGVPTIYGAPGVLSEDDIPGIVQTLEQANDPEFPNTIYDPTREACEAQCKVFIGDPLQQCAVDLCGPPEEHSSEKKYSFNKDIDYDKVDEQKLNELSEEFEADIQPAIVRAMEERRTLANLLLENINKQIAQWEALERNGYSPEPHRLARFKSNKSAVEHKLNNPAEWQAKGLNRCKADFVTHRLFYDKVKDFKENKTQYIEQFMNNVVSGYSQESRTLFDDYVKRIEFEFPEDPTSDILRNIEEDIDDISGVRVFDVCRGMSSSVNITDKVSYPKGVRRTSNLKVSFFSCQFHEHGKGIFVHELGHVFSFQFASAGLSQESYMKYLQLRKCVQNRYKNDQTNSQYNRNFIHPGDKLQTEEWTADLMSYLSFPNTNIISCANLDTQENSDRDYQLEYKGLTVFDNSKRHPSPFLRVLIEAIHKGKELSVACQQVVEMNKDKINFEPCRTP